MTLTRRLTLATLAASVVAACSPLRALNALSPGDPGVRRLVQGVPFGPGERQALDVYAPAGEGSRPLVVFVYGGSWSSGRRQDYAWAARAIAAQGFTVAVPDYRLIPEVRFPSFVEDVAAAVAAARRGARGWGGDPDRIVLAGHSAGAYIAVLLALDPRYLERAGVPMSAIRGAAGLAGPYDFYPFDAQSAVAAFGRAPDPAQTQPITFARGDAPPLWLASGDADDTVRPRNSLRLAEAVQARGGRAETRLYPGLSHTDIVLALARPFRGRGPVLADLAAFVREVAS